MNANYRMSTMAQDAESYTLPQIPVIQRLFFLGGERILLVWVTNSAFKRISTNFPKACMEPKTLTFSEQVVSFPSIHKMILNPFSLSLLYED